jgi:hypothetical protein
VAAEFTALDLADLSGQHEPLILGQLGGERDHAQQLIPQDHDLLELGAHVGDVEPRVSPVRLVEHCGALHQRLHRAAPAESSPAVADPRHESLLEGICDVQTAGEPATAARVRQQLEHGLAVAVFEILTSQLVPVDPQQQLTPGARNARELLGHLVG